jgi:hypothetical protein
LIFSDQTPPIRRCRSPSIQIFRPIKEAGASAGFSSEIQGNCAHIKAKLTILILINRTLFALCYTLPKFAPVSSKQGNRFMNKNPETTDSVLARMLDDMEFLGLIKLRTNESEKSHSFATEQISGQTEHQSNLSEKAA